MWEFICFGTIGLAILFLWFTALTGTKYYEISVQLRDIKFLKFLIHISTLLSFSALAYIIWLGSQINV